MNTQRSMQILGFKHLSTNKFLRNIPKTTGAINSLPCVIERALYFDITLLLLYHYLSF